MGYVPGIFLMLRRATLVVDEYMPFNGTLLLSFI